MIRVENGASRDPELEWLFTPIGTPPPREIDTPRPRRYRTARDVGESESVYPLHASPTPFHEPWDLTLEEHIEMYRMELGDKQDPPLPSNPVTQGKVGKKA